MINQVGDEKEARKAVRRFLAILVVIMPAPKQKPVISIQDVKMSYSLGDVEVPVLHGVSFEVYKGEFVAITGPSGSGKSTLMYLVGCLDYPTSGTIKLDGTDITQLTESDLAQVRGKKIGFIFQSFNLVKYLSAMENVSLPLMFRGITAGKRAELAKKFLEKVGLSHRLDHKPSELSGGEQQRVAIARALAGEPELILADEPTGNLDSKTGAEIIEMLEKLHAEGKTIVMITHDPGLAKRANRIVRIRDGRIEKGG